ncbi:MAG: HupE/UreJ family protein [Planctomycetaceae bacterium]|nr:HupE/UreJ family protein [Planctomycetaceae bacterium]
MRLWIIGLIVLGLGLTASPAMAHPQHAFSSSGGFLEGLTHPWFGLDHLLAMVTVGLLAVRMGRKAIWMLPASFLGCLGLGAMLGLIGGSLPLVEVGIALSVVLLGASLMFRSDFPLLSVVLVMGGMGLFHGHAHGTEMPTLATPAYYFTGFFMATAALHTLGIVSGKYLTQSDHGIRFLRLAGAVISCAGIGILLA